MTNKLKILWHYWRASKHWAAISDIVDGCPATHRYLLAYSPRYYNHCVKYNESLNYLIANNAYTPARSLLRR